jgi:hypothetical protein
MARFEPQVTTWAARLGGVTPNGIEHLRIGPQPQPRGIAFVGTATCHASPQISTGRRGAA